MESPRRKLIIRIESFASSINEAESHDKYTNVGLQAIIRDTRREEFN